MIALSIVGATLLGMLVTGLVSRWIARRAIGRGRQRALQSPPQRRGVATTARGHVLLTSELDAQVVDRTSVGLVVCDDQRFYRVNPAACAALGHPAAALLSQSYWDLIHPDDRPASRNVVVTNQVVVRGAGEFENRYLAADGTIRRCRWHASTFDAQGLAVCEVELVGVEVPE